MDLPIPSLIRGKLGKHYNGDMSEILTTCWFKNTWNAASSYLFSHHTKQGNAFSFLAQWIQRLSIHICSHPIASLRDGLSCMSEMHIVIAHDLLLPNYQAGHNSKRIWIIPINWLLLRNIINIQENNTLQIIQTNDQRD